MTFKIVLNLNGLQHINQKLYVFLEKRDQSRLLVDFVESGAFQSFITIIETVISGIDIKDPSMVLIKNYKGKKGREGVTYELNTEAIEHVIANGQIISTLQNSVVIGFEIDMANNPHELFKGSKSFNQEERWELNLELSSKKELPKIELDGKTKVVVRNVGQGSWNELFVDNKLKLIFDIGTSYQAKRVQVEKLNLGREELIQKDKPGVIISHWDIDHYHCLIPMSDETLSSIQFFCFRNYLPTLTSRKIYSRIRELLSSKNVYPIEPFPKAEKGLGYAPLKKIKNDSKNVIFYNSCKHQDRNQNAICLAIRKSKSSVVLPADTHYKQISKSILPDLGYENEHYLIVPHHGGKAGNFLYKIDKSSKLKTAIVSVGRNSYGHPNRDYLNQLRGIGFKVKSTMIMKRDFEIELK